MEARTARLCGTDAYCDLHGAGIIAVDEEWVEEMAGRPGGAVRHEKPITTIYIYFAPYWHSRRMLNDTGSRQRTDPPARRRSRLGGRNRVLVRSWLQRSSHLEW
jgi:hypothetical protein